jgi:hypothetical protein
LSQPSREPVSLFRKPQYSTNKAKEFGQQKLPTIDRPERCRGVSEIQITRRLNLAVPVVDFSGQLQDVLSAVYFIRTHPLHVGKPFEVFIGENGRVVRIPVQVVEKKSMRTILGKVKVVRVEPQLFGEDKLIKDEDGEFIVWITDDDRHIPVSARVKTDYGTFDIRLKRADINKL